MKPFIFIISVVALLAVSNLSIYSQQEIPRDLSITLKRSMCFGWCPAYTLTITAAGTVQFIPEGEFAYRGDGPMPSLPLTGEMAKDQLSVLLTEFGKIKFYSLQKHYGRAGRSADGPSCPHYWTDQPSADVTIVSNGKRKTVDHYLGCDGTRILDDLVALENKIDEIANSKQWTSQFGWGAASVVDLKLQINRSTPPKSEKPR